MDELRDHLYYMQLARVARLKAAATEDADLARRLREAAIKNERKARQINRRESAPDLRNLQDKVSAKLAGIRDKVQDP